MAARRAYRPALYGADARPGPRGRERVVALAALSLALLTFSLCARIANGSPLGAARLVAAKALAADGLPPVRISQVYGGGSGAVGEGALPDFVELFNAGPEAVNLDGWSVRVAPPLKDRWTHLPLRNSVIAGYGYLLVVLSDGGGGSPLGAAAGDVAGDVVAVGSLQTGRGKVVVADAAGIVIDRVGYGDANEVEGSAPAPAASTELALWRLEGGCVDSDRNDADFELAPPRPRNSAAPLHPCPLPPAETPTPRPAGSRTATETPTATPAFWPVLLFSEIMADPYAVVDKQGEWFEVYNPGVEAVNLRGWLIADGGSAQHQIVAEAWIQPGAYAVFARSGDAALNGGVYPIYVYDDVELSNAYATLRLLAPDGQEVARLAWGNDAPQRMTQGASLERLDVTGDVWVPAHSRWPGSAGDRGSPGAPYAPPPTETPTETPTEMPTEMPTPEPALTPEPTFTVTATPLPTETSTPVPLPTFTPTPTLTVPAALPRLRLSELMADPAAVPDDVGEWIEIANLDAMAVNLNGWTLADLDRDRHRIAVDLWLQPGEYAVLARNGDPARNGGVSARYVYANLELANQGDELILNAPWGVEADRVVWPNAGSIRAGASLERSDLWANAWVAASAAWPGSAGDFGSPGVPYTLPPAAPTATPTATPTFVLVATNTPYPDRPPPLVISEVMADPAAVGDDVGEWFEIYNAGALPVNLVGWQLTDLGRDAHTVALNVVIQPGEYAIFARSGDANVNGGVYPHYVYSGLALANQNDEIVLRAPWGVEVSRALWGEQAGIRTRAGVSLERTGMGTEAVWVYAGAPWPGSAGDKGSPGFGYIAVPTPPPTPLPPDVWARAFSTSALVIEEVYNRGGDTEFIALLNRGGAPVSTAGWLVGDAETPGSEGLYALPADVSLAPGALFVIARNGAAFRAAWGRAPDAEFEDSDPAIPDVTRRSDLASGQLALDDSGDEVVLLAPDLTLADALAFGDAAYAALGLFGELRSGSPLGQEMSLQRVPAPGDGSTLYWEQDQRYRFLSAPPQPFTTVALPTAQLRPHPSLPRGLIALWGSLGVASNFSPDGVAPPHYLLAAAGAQGLDFLAVADPGGAHGDVLPYGSAQSLPLAIPAWRWESGSGERAVVYGPDALPFSRWADLTAHLNLYRIPAQAFGAPGDGSLPLVDGSRVTIPDGIPALLDRRRSEGAPSLLAGNSSPPLPGFLDPSPRYTGLAVTAADLSGVQAALGERRGWLTNRPGLWLTLLAESGSGDPVWMGGTMDAANQVTLRVDYGDGYGSGGEIAGLALWQDNRVVYRNDSGLSGGRWSVSLPAVPGTFLYAVATQLDGDFAVTAPIYVRGPAAGRVYLNEVHPLPDRDLNGDGATNGDDEFVELFNPGPAPVALDGWRILLGAGETERHYTLGPQHVLPGGGWLVFWRGHTQLNLDEAGGALRLVNRDGALVDEFSWGGSPGNGRSHSRFPNGSSWFGDTSPTPGGSNAAREPSGRDPSGGKPSPPDVDDSDDDGVLPPTYGQAGGPPGSLAQAKLAGLEAQVEFRAQVTVPPGLFNSAIYVAEPALDANGNPLATGGLGIHVFLYEGDYPALEEGDWVLLRGELASFRGEMELRPARPEDVWRIGPGVPLAPLPVRVPEIGESLEGRLVTFTGEISGWQGESLYLSDPESPETPAVRVTVRSSLEWKRPYVQHGEVYSVTGVVSQFASAHPWNGGYRVLVRYKSDLVRR